MREDDVGRNWRSGKCEDCGEKVPAMEGYYIGSCSMKYHNSWGRTYERRVDMILCDFCKATSDWKYDAERRALPGEVFSTGF